MSTDVHRDGCVRMSSPIPTSALALICTSRMTTTTKNWTIERRVPHKLAFRCDTAGSRLTGRSPDHVEHSGSKVDSRDIGTDIVDELSVGVLDPRPVRQVDGALNRSNRSDRAKQSEKYDAADSRSNKAEIREARARTPTPELRMKKWFMHRVDRVKRASKPIHIPIPRPMCGPEVPLIRAS